MIDETNKGPPEEMLTRDSDESRQVSDELVTQWQTVVEQKRVEVDNAGETIAHTAPVETFERQTTLGTLPRLDADRDVTEFKVKETIGQGGMGLIRQARQTSLWRDVAIKTILPDKIDAGATQDLLRESWITGMLEHPNIVPVYALGVDENDAPMLVMKQVEGISWGQALENEEALPDAFRGGGDILEDHLDILLQVSNAVEFAHSRGIIHCDLKPENIMLGDYGEVYLLDWGIAVSIQEQDESGRLPRAEDVSDVSGTPAYIAPELAEGAGEKIDESTDIYLLGAILHEIVTGSPRHVSSSVMGTLVKAYRSEPVDYNESVPDELAEICNRATDVDPENRFRDIEGFRSAIREFLQHRDSKRLSDEASRRLEKLESLAELEFSRAEGSKSVNKTFAEDVRAKAAEAYGVFSECRFGFQQAIEVWEDNDEARRNLRRAKEVMIDIELRQRDAKSASVLLDELDQSSDRHDEFADRLEQLRRELAEEAEEIERNKQISRDVDISLASRQRSIMCVFLGFLFGGVPFINHWLIERGWATLTFQDYFIQFGVITIGAAVIVAALRDRLLKNAINRRIILSVFIILGGCLTMRILGYFLGLDPGGCIALEQGLLAFGLAMMAASIDWRLWPASVAFFLGGVGGAVYPEHILHFDGASNAAALWLIAFVWRQPKDENDASREIN